MPAEPGWTGSHTQYFRVLGMVPCTAFRHSTPSQNAFLPFIIDSLSIEVALAVISEVVVGEA